MKITLSQLKQIIKEELVYNEAAPTIRKNKANLKAPARKTSPASLLKQITDALATLDFSVKSREKNLGALKAWLDPVNQDQEEMAPRARPLDKDSIAMKYKLQVGNLIRNAMKVLAAIGLTTTTTGDKFETVLQGEGFDVHFSHEDGGHDIGAAILVQVFAGKHADLERSGFDTSDLSFGEGTLREAVMTSTGDVNEQLEDAVVAYLENKMKTARLLTLPGLHEMLMNEVESTFQMFSVSFPNNPLYTQYKKK